THGKPAAEAKRIAADKQKKFGNGWVMLPNPTYGGWERTGDDLRTQRTSRPSQQTEASQPSAASATAKSPMPNVIRSNQIPSQTQWVPSPQPTVIPLPMSMKNQPCQCPCCRCWQRPRRVNSRR
ncbi:MAG: hypothetical protein AB8G99_07925, partial [Planctomycetaceae bacterium]